jgi:hypothetical protein
MSNSDSSGYIVFGFIVQFNVMNKDLAYQPYTLCKNSHRANAYKLGLLLAHYKIIFMFSPHAHQGVQSQEPPVLESKVAHLTNFNKKRI